MADSKGPKVELPEDLEAELAQAAEAEPLTSERVAEPEPGEETEAEPAPAEAGPAELDALRDKYLRLAADFENYKRRNLKERAELFNYGNENLIKELLPVVDNLERALGHARTGEEGSETQALVEGVELTHRSLLQVLERFGVQRVEAEGTEFDPKVHEAVRQIPSDAQPPGHVIEVFQTGYTLKDRLLRPAMVVVATEPESGSD